jgi:hypothetical protein
MKELLNLKEKVIMDRDYVILEEYRMYTEQKENFIDRNFRTNKFYMISIIALIFAMIYTNNIMFLNKISATLVFAFFGIAASSLWWMNVDSYNTLIKIKYADVIEKIEEKLPIHPFADEYKSIEEFKNKKIFMFSDIQKLIAVVAALFFFAVCISELSPICVKIFEKLVSLKAGI